MELTGIYNQGVASGLLVEPKTYSPNPTWEYGYIQSSDGKESASNTRFVRSDVIRLRSGQSICWLAKIDSGAYALSAWNARLDIQNNAWTVADHTAAGVGIVTGDGKPHYYEYTATQNMYVRISTCLSGSSGDSSYYPSPEAVGASTRVYYKDVAFADDPLYGKTITAIGDSLIYGYTNGPDVTWLRMLALRHGMTAHNMGINGNRVASTGSGDTGNPMVQRYVNIPQSDYIVLLGGANDWSAQIPVGELSEAVYQPYETPYTFYGALGIIIRGIRAAQPRARLLFLTNYKRYARNNSASPAVHEYAYVEAMVNACAGMGVMCFNNYASSGMDFNDANMGWADEGVVNGGSINRHISVEAYARLLPLYENILANQMWA